MKCSDISPRLVDFLYEEMSVSERAEFSAHLATCPTCAAEVKASSRALQRTRTALRGPLNEEPPTRVHANILAAARAAAAPVAIRKPPVEEREGFFSRLWKAPWLVPAMGAAGVATAVFLIKVLKNPEVLPVREPASPAVVAKPQPTEDKAPLPAAAPEAPQAEAVPLEVVKGEERKAPPGKRDRMGSGSARTSPSPQAVARMKRIMDDPLDGIGAGPKNQEPVAPEQHQALSDRAAPSPKPAATARPLNNWAEPPPPRRAATKRGQADDVDMLLKEGASGAGADQPRGELLQARPQRAAEAPRPAPPSAAASGFALPPAPPPAPAKAAPAPSAPRAKARLSAEAEATADEAAESADKQADKAEKKGGASKDSFDERVRKAERLYNERRWSEAAAAYRALLNQAPNHPSAPVWRQRMVYAENAKDGSPLVKPAKKVSDDALDGM